VFEGNFMNESKRIERRGVNPKFYSIKRYLNMEIISGKDFRAERASVEATKTWPNLRRFAEEGVFKLPAVTLGGVLFDDDWFDGFQAGQCFAQLASDYFQMGAIEALGQSPGALATWNKAVAYSFYDHAIYLEVAAINLDAYRAGKRELLSTALFFNSLVPTSARVISYGLENEGLSLARAICDWSHVEATENGRLRQGMQGAYNDFGSNITHHFVMRLICDWQGWPQYRVPPCAFEEPVFNELISHWRTDDLPLLTHLLLCACDRHTYEANFGSDSRCIYPDLMRFHLFYDPFEIRLVLYLRKKLGLPNPEIDHVLMNTALGALPEPIPLFRDELIDAVMVKVRKEYPNV
jgi:hypothetical protein